MDDRTLKLLLLQNYQLLERLDPDKAELYQQYKEILREGIVYDYSTMFDELPREEDCIPFEISEEVIEIVHMFIHIGKSIRVSHYEMKVPYYFLGFNHHDDDEWHHARYAEHYLRRLDEQQDLDLTSYHLRTEKKSYLSSYRDMLKVYHPYQYDDYLTYEVLESILNCYTHK
ncbi:YfbU family protein [Macrococcus equipercicus]|nr:YfbU family protein [Macrococcus equipercicus]UTH13781.1 YfbU family protein [Macrococcus equipercicus]